MLFFIFHFPLFVIFNIENPVALLLEALFSTRRKISIGERGRLLFEDKWQWKMANGK